MNGILILLLLIVAASLPAIIVLFWLRAKKSAVTLPWYLVSLAAGIVSLIAAALIQSLFSPSTTGILTGDGPGPLFFGIFIRIALVEEASRLITLFPLLKAGRRSRTGSAFAATLGLVAGLGFALIESASYGMANINITLLRTFTAAPLHGACGIRAGMAAFTARRQPLKALFHFTTAVLIHGAYNLIIVSPALPSALAIPAAFTALFSSLHFIKADDKESEDNNFPETPLT